MQTINIIAHTDDPLQIKAINAVLKAFKIKFSISKTNDLDPEFVAMIKKGQKEIKDGKGIKITLDELENLCK